MPYSGPSDPKLPDHVKKMSGSKKKQWVHVFNSAMDKHHDEGKAFAMANGVAKKENVVIVSGNKAFTEDVWNIGEIDKRQVSQEKAAYDPFGAKGGKGCANCQWFISPNSCILVAGDISPSGISKFYTAAEDTVDEPVPYPVYIVDKSAEQLTPEMLQEAAKSDSGNTVIKSAVEWFKGLVGAKPPELQPFWLIKSKEAQWRYFMVYSNQFKDKVAETITEAAHKEYVEWVEKTGVHAEAHLWHGGPDTKWGQDDFVDYVDGFAICSGLVDKGKEHIAEALEVDAKEGKLKVSHGFYGLKSADGTYLLYRRFESSPLPLGAEANQWTGLAFDVFETKEAEMPFSDAKRAWLKEKMGVPDAKIAEIEASFKGAAESLKANGIEFKEAGSEPVTKDAATGAADPLATIVAEFKGFGDSMKSLADSVASSKTEMQAALKSQDEKIDAMAVIVKEVVERQQKSHDDIVAEAYKAAANGAGAGGAAAPVFKASEQATSTAAAKPVNNGAGDWLSEMIDKQLGVGVEQAVQQSALNVVGGS